MSHIKLEPKQQGCQQSEVEYLRAELEGHKAARMAYASEFPLNEEGEPDVGSIHQNIRALKAELAALKAAMEEPVAWTTGINWHPDAHYQSEQVQKLTRKEQPEYGFIVALYYIPKDKP